jgi:RNA-binding protein
LLQVGAVLHRAKSGSLIVRLSREVRTGAFILDDKGRRLGKVVELIGPVKAPYASIALSTDRPGKSGDSAFIQS